jgi:outer membrane receptor for ferrienterochelin and colicin
MCGVKFQPLAFMPSVAVSQPDPMNARIDSLKPDSPPTPRAGRTPRASPSRLAMSTRRRVASTIGIWIALLPFMLNGNWARASRKDQNEGGSLKQLSLEQLGNVEVTTASKKPEEVWHTPAAIYVITQEDIRRSGATSIPEILRLAPGIEVARIDSDHWSVGIRGFGSQFSKSVLVLIDGRSVYTPLDSGVNWQFQDTLLEDIERIEIIRGPGGTIWGANAVNGIINRTLVASRFYVDFAAFYNDYKDLYGYGPGSLLFEPLPVPTRTILQLPVANALSGTTDGIEIAPDWKPVDWWELKGSYSYLHLAVQIKPGNMDPLGVVSSDNGSSPHHQIQLQSQFNLPKKFELDMTFRYISALPAQTVTAYGSADIRFGWRPTSDWDLSVAGQNLLQPRHAEFGGDASAMVGIKRSAYAKITWRR